MVRFCLVELVFSFVLWGAFVGVWGAILISVLFITI